MAKDFFKQFIDDLGESETTIAADGKSSAEYSALVDSGAYILNAGLSGSLFGGFPDNKTLLLAGDPAVGKSFFALGITKSFLDQDPTARVIYYDTESAVTNKMMTDRGIALDRVAKSEPMTLEAFRNSCAMMLDCYKEIPVAQRFPLLVVLDSLSALPSLKEVTDIAADDDKNTKDMTKPGIVKGMFRVLRLKSSKLCVPMVITNHTYQTLGLYASKVVSGGMGAQYAADIIVMLSKKQEKIDDEVVGNIVHVHLKKSRLSKENTKVDVRILYNGGLDKYYGILPYAEAAGIIKKSGNKYEFPDGTKAFEKTINRTPEKFFTREFLDKLEPYINSQFTYSAGQPTEPEEVDDDTAE